MKADGILHLDLHGCSVKEAQQRVEAIFLSIRETRINQIYIITGRGNHVNPNGTRGVLKQILPSLLKPYAEDIFQVDKELGAYKIILKKVAIDSDYEKLKEIIAAFAGSPVETAIAAEIQQLEEKAQQNSMEAIFELAKIHLAGLYKKFDDKTKGLQLLQRAHEGGKLEATTLLGQLYLEETDICNPQKAFRLLKRAAERQDPNAQFYLARCYLVGEGVRKDDAIGRMWMQKAADLEMIVACDTLGHSYLTGDFTEKNPKLGVTYLDKAVLKGYAPAQTHLARCYATGHGVKQNDRMAFSLYSHAAQCEDVYALYQLGQYYSVGRVVEQNTEKAFEYFMHAAVLGDTEAQGRVAMAYLQGEGVVKNIPEGIKWLEKLVDKKSPEACFEMSHLYRIGHGVKEDDNKADKLLQLAAKAGLPAAQYEWGSFLLLEKKDEAGFSWLDKALANDNNNEDDENESPLFNKVFKKTIAEKNPEIRLILNCLIRHAGIGLPSDWRQLEQDIVKKARSGDAQTQFELSSLYFLAGDEVSASYWLSRAYQSKYPEAASKLSATTSPNLYQLTQVPVVSYGAGRSLENPQQQEADLAPSLSHILDNEENPVEEVTEELASSHDTWSCRVS